MPTEPWFSYPPEMNASRILGPGPGPWIAAAATWAVQAAEAAAAQAIFQAQNGIQVSNIDGATSGAVATHIGPFGAWLANLNAEAARATMEHMSVATSYSNSLAATVPLPVIAANRATAAAAHAASAAGAVNPAGVAADAEYARYQIQNATAMQSYDTTAQVATTPRTYSPPPPLTTGGDVSSTADLGRILSQQADPAAMQSKVAEMQSRLTDPSTISNLQSSAQNTVAQFASQPAALSPAQVQQAQAAMMPASMVVGQMAQAGPGGVAYSGLGTINGAMAPMGAYGTGATSGGSGMARGGGLPIGSMLGTGSHSAGGSSSHPIRGLSSVSTSPGGGGMSRAGLSSLARMLAGAGALAPAPSAPATPGMPMAGGGGRAFSGIAGEPGAPARGGMPMGAMPHSNAGGGGKRSKVEAEDIEVVDVLAEKEQERRRMAVFR